MDQRDAIASPNRAAAEAMAHDLNNSLATISGFSEIASEHLQKLRQSLAGNPETDAQVAALGGMLESIVRCVEESHDIITRHAPSSDAITAPFVPDSSETDIRTDTRIMVIDDSPNLTNLMKNVLSRAGYAVEAFTDPIAALDRFTGASGHFDLVITDILMPGITGSALIQQIRLLRQDMPVILCTGSTERTPFDTIPADRLNAVVRKPYRPRNLAAVVREMLAA